MYLVHEKGRGRVLFIYSLMHKLILPNQEPKVL